ncbi:MerR family transcriptional regulator [uncultured Corynebacterium sp.]|uniref:MerR family transcriptional regulator n=1 Tax=uncultured Corynebacterium sp. TaxID=159447 RepID=UPI0025D42A18|nr:MerR family transcriptional regulator [uncultured Corynebacterium sp.]
MKISDVARILGCSIRTIRHYHQQGAVPEPARRANGYRDYSIRDVARLIIVRQLVTSGIPVKDVNSASLDELACVALASVDRRIAELEEQRRRLVVLRDHGIQLPDPSLMSEFDGALKQCGLDKEAREREIHSWELMAVSGVATKQTWSQLQANVRDSSCVESHMRGISLWNELARYGQGEAPESLLVEWADEFSSGLMKGIMVTLQQGSLHLEPSDMALQGAQVDAVKYA